MRIFAIFGSVGLWFWVRGGGGGGGVAAFKNSHTQTSLTRTFTKELKTESDWTKKAVHNLRDKMSTGGSILNHNDNQRHLAIADASACTSTILPYDPSYIGTTTLCPDLCGPGRDYAISTFTYALYTVQLCQIPCEEELVECVGPIEEQDRNAENDCSLCDYGITAGGGLRSCFFNSDGNWQCYHESFPLSWVPAPESATIYICDTLPEIEPTPENCACDIYLGDPTAFPYDLDQLCQSCTIISTPLDGETSHYYDCSNLLEGSCVGEDESGCISNVPTSPTTPVADTSPTTPLPPVSTSPVTSPPVLTPADSPTSMPNPTTSAPLPIVTADTPVTTKPPTEEPESLNSEGANTVPTTNANAMTPPIVAEQTGSGSTTSMAPTSRKNWSTILLLGAALFIWL